MGVLGFVVGPFSGLGFLGAHVGRVWEWLCRAT